MDRNYPGPCNSPTCWNSVNGTTFSTININVYRTTSANDGSGCTSGNTNAGSNTFTLLPNCYGTPASNQFTMTNQCCTLCSYAVSGLSTFITPSGSTQWYNSGSTSLTATTDARVTFSVSFRANPTTNICEFNFYFSVVGTGYTTPFCCYPPIPSWQTGWLPMTSFIGANSASNTTTGSCGAGTWSQTITGTITVS